MKPAFTEKIFETGRDTDNRWRLVSTFGFLLQRPAAFRHQGEKDRVGHAEQRGEGDVREI
jgi:hypothetical protein